MSLAAEARAAIRDRPFLYHALRTGVINYTAAAEYLDLDGDPEAVATALRRYAEELPAPSRDRRRVTVRMQRGVGVSNGADSQTSLVTIGDLSIVADAGSDTAILATGEVDPPILGSVLDRLTIADVVPVAAGATDDTLVVVVPRRDGVDALRLVEDVVESPMR